MIKYTEVYDITRVFVDNRSTVCHKSDGDMEGNFKFGPFTGDSDGTLADIPSRHGLKYYSPLFLKEWAGKILKANFLNQRHRIFHL
jgi:hypothetical protein